MVTFKVELTKEAPVVRGGGAPLPLPWGDTLETLNKAKAGEWAAFLVPLAFWTDDRDISDPDALAPRSCQSRIRAAFASFRKNTEKENGGKFLGAKVTMSDQYDKNQKYLGTRVYMVKEADADRKANIERGKRLAGSAKKPRKAAKKKAA